MAGTVLALYVDPGQNVDPSTVLLTLADLSQLIVETNVDEAYATQIRAGMPAVLQLAGDAASHDGRVSFVSQRVGRRHRWPRHEARFSTTTSKHPSGLR